jgi:hypothetical protein
MKPIEEVKRIFLYEPHDHPTIAGMERWLNETYPEAKWTIKPNYNEVGEIIVDAIEIYCDFANEVERTFYTLKWL